MKTCVKEIIEDIKNNPQDWKPVVNSYQFTGIEKDRIRITGYGNTRTLSVISLEIDGKAIQLTEFFYCEKWHLESTVMWWYNHCSVDLLLGEQQ